MRGDESSKLTLVALSTHRNLSTAPLSLEGMQIDLLWTKNNRGDKVDNRVLAYHKVMHMCPLLHLALHFWAKLNPQGGAAPFQWADILSGEWCGSGFKPCHLTSAPSQLPFRSSFASSGQSIRPYTRAYLHTGVSALYAGNCFSFWTPTSQWGLSGNALPTYRRWPAESRR